MEDKKLPEAAKQHVRVLEILKLAQLQNGLRHSDYHRYQRYCTMRLRRLRTHVARANGIKVSSGRGRKTRPLKLNDVPLVDERPILILLMSAERAWAVAQMLKQDLEQGAAMNPSRQRHHLVRRLAKALQYSRQLVTLCETYGESQTVLESESYSAFLGGLLNMERGLWQPALDLFMSSGHICSQLATIGTQDQRDVYKSRLEGLAPNIRYCKYNLARERGDDMSALDATDFTIAPDNDMLKARVQSVIENVRRENAGSSLVGGTFRVPVYQKQGDTSSKTLREVRIPNDAIRSLMANWVNTSTEILELIEKETFEKGLDSIVDLGGAGIDRLPLELSRYLSSSLSTPAPSVRVREKAAASAGGYGELTLELFDRLFITGGDLAQSFRDLNSPGPDTLALRDYFASELARQRVIRGVVMCDQYRLRYAYGPTPAQRRAAERPLRLVRGEDVTKLCDVVLRDIVEWESSSGSGGDAEGSGRKAAALQAEYSAHRSFFLAEGHADNGGLDNAVALYDRAETSMRKAAESYHELRDARAETRCRLHADLHAAVAATVVAAAALEQEAAAAAGRGEGAMDVEGPAGAAVAQQPSVLKSLDSVPAVGAPLAEIPPPFRVSMVKPLFFDLFLNKVVYPKLPRKIPKPKPKARIAKPKPKAVAEAENGTDKPKRGLFGLFGKK